MSLPPITTFGFGSTNIFSTPPTQYISSTAPGSGQAFPIPVEPAPGGGVGTDPTQSFPTTPLPPLGSPSRPEPFYPPNYRGGLNIDKFQRVSPPGASGGITDPSRRVDTSTTGLPRRGYLDTSKFQKVGTVAGGPYIWKYQ